MIVVVLAEDIVGARTRAERAFGVRLLGMPGLVPIPGEDTGARVATNEGRSMLRLVRTSAWSTLQQDCPLR